MKNRLTTLLFLFLANVAAVSAQDNMDYKNCDFVPGERILFEDNLAGDKAGEQPRLWQVEGGKAAVALENEAQCISILAYYTRLSPRLALKPGLPDSFTLEYDTWLDAGYDGNPGVEIHFSRGDAEIIVTPNKHELTVVYPNGRESAENPAEYFGENKFYNRWVHIALSYANRSLTVYLDQHRMLRIADCGLKPDKLVFTGNTSQDMKILLRNVRLATALRPRTFALTNGKFVTHAITFDVNRATLKPESMGILAEIAEYAKNNTAARFEIAGHTDGDGDDAFNQKLSEERAQAVKKALVALGARDDQFVAKGYGKSKPLDTNATPEGKANNRRVEFNRF